MGGGAISGGGNSTLILNGTVAFTDNRNMDTRLGGAITLRESSVAIIVGNVYFTNNSAFLGAIDLHGNLIVSWFSMALSYSLIATLDLVGLLLQLEIAV